MSEDDKQGMWAEEIYERHARRVIGFFISRASRDDAEDLAQDVFYRVLLHLDQFRGDAELWSWIFKIAIKVYRNSLRARRCEKWGFGRNSPIDQLLSDSPHRVPPVCEENALERLGSIERRKHALNLGFY